MLPGRDTCAGFYRSQCHLLDQSCCSMGCTSLYNLKDHLHRLGRQGSRNSRQNETLPSSIRSSLLGRYSLVVTRQTITSRPVQRSQNSKHESFQSFRLQILSMFASLERTNRSHLPLREEGGVLMRAGFSWGPVCPLQRAEWTRSPSPTLLV